MATPAKLVAAGSEDAAEILAFSAGVVTIGREPENTLAVDSISVSRQHGKILEAGPYWLFLDCGSTNGSWLNGAVVEEGLYRLLRNGDRLKLADFEVEFRLESEIPAVENISFLIFWEGKFESFREIPSGSTNFSLGGPGADFILEGLSGAGNIGTFSHSSGGLEFTLAENASAVSVNGTPVTGTVALEDGDNLQIGSFTLLLSDPKEAAVGTGVGKDSGGASLFGRQNITEASAGKTKPWDDVMQTSRGSGSRKKFVFGTPPDSEGGTRMMEQTMTMPAFKSDSSGGLPTGPSLRFSVQAATQESQQRVVMSEKILVVLGFVVVLVVAIIAFMLFQFL